MKLFFTFLLFVSFEIYAQDYTKIDRIVQSYPKYTSPQQLANRISDDFDDDISKARAAFRWLTLHIRYDLEEYYQPKQPIRFQYRTQQEYNQKIKAIKSNLVKDTFLTKMGICEDYAQSFKKLADLLGIESQVVKGYTRNSAQDIGKVPPAPNHAWNAVKINQKWMMLDPTWAAGYLSYGRWIKNFNASFFDINPQKIKRTHYPSDRIWQILFNYHSLVSFYNQPIYSPLLFKSDVELISPTKGTIEINRSEKVILKFKKLLKRDLIFYNYLGERLPQQAEISYEGTTATVSLENPQRNCELHVFLNKVLALKFNIRIK
ncbi:MAG: transglutaminase [Flavobacteriales bacterium]|nr:transglutaminase [Flavobacteriales bacterium]